MELLIVLVPALPLAGFLFAVLAGPRLDNLPPPVVESHAAGPATAGPSASDDAAVPSEAEQAATSPHAGHADDLANAAGADGVIPPELRDGVGHAAHPAREGRQRHRSWVVPTALVGIGWVRSMAIFVMHGTFVFNAQGLAGAVFQMLSHGITTGALFLLVGVIYERTHDRRIAHMGGLNARMPAYAAMFGLFTFASIGLPGLSGFVGEFLVILGAFRFNGLIAAAAALVVIASAAYMLWMFQRAFFAIPSGRMRRWWPSLRDLSGREWIALSPLVVLVVALGVYPAPVLDLIAGSVARIADAAAGSPGLTLLPLP